MKQKIRDFLRSLRTDRQKSIVVIFVILFVVVGVWLLIGSNAATPAVSIEPEKGTLSGSAAVVNDSGASGGKAVQFKTPPTPPPTDTWGNHMGISLALPDNNTTLAYKNIDSTHALGIKWIRMGRELSWGAGNNTQAYINYAHNKGLKILWVCQKSPHTYYESDITAFANYCADWVNYKVDAIEIGNEWNHVPFWQANPTGDYSLQAKITDATTNAIRAKSSSIPIMNAGWSPEATPNSPSEAMAKLLDAAPAFKQKGTNIAHHGYAWNCSTGVLACGYPERKDWNAFLGTQDVYAAAKARGFNKGVWITEIGGPSSGTGISGVVFTQATQAQLYRDYITGIKQMRAAGTPIDVIFWHTIQEGQSFVSGDNPTFGIYDTNWGLKQAGQVVKDQASQAW